MCVVCCKEETLGKRECVVYEEGESFAHSIVGTQVKGLTHTYGPIRNFIPHVRQTRHLQVAAHIPYQIW